LSVSNSGFIVSKLSTSALFSTPQQIPWSELSDSDSVLSFSISGSVPKVPESLVKLESLVDLLSRLGNSLSLESLFWVFFFLPIGVCFCFLVFVLPVLVLFLARLCSLPCLVFQFNSCSSIFLWLYNDNYCPILHSGLRFHVITTSGDFSLLFPLALHESSWASMSLCLSCLAPWSRICDISHSDLLIDQNIITTYPTKSA